MLIAYAVIISKFEKRLCFFILLCFVFVLLQIDGDIGTIGISNHAQEALGDLVFIELPEEGEEFNSGYAHVTIPCTTH